MDAESLAQIEQIVSGAEGRLRSEMKGLDESLRQEFSEKTDALATTIRQEMGEPAHALRQEIAEKFEAAERHSGLLHEDVLRRLDLVVEGFEGLRQGQTALRQMTEHESLELQALMKLSYRQLQERVETLEQRVQLIEKRLGRIN